MRQLTSSDLAELEASLQLARAQVVARVHAQLGGRDADEVRTLVNHLTDGDSRAASELLNDTEIALLQHDISELEAIDAALKRIDFGTGGLCTACGEPIPLARLRAAPTAVTCVQCQADIEAKR